MNYKKIENGHIGRHRLMIFFRMAAFIIFSYLSFGCSYKIAEKGRKFSVDEDLDNPGLFQRVDQCGYFDDKQKNRDILSAKAYCKQFDKIPVIFSQKFNPSRMRIEDVPVSFNVCLTQFSCVINKQTQPSEEPYSTAILGIQIDSQGSAISSTILESSGSQYLDSKALLSVKNITFDVDKFPTNKVIKRKIVIKINKDNYKQY
jgi:TonB family protein